MRAIINKNLKSLEDYLPFIELSCNISIRSSTYYSLFEIFYGFYPLTPMDFIPLLINARANLDDQKEADLVKSNYEKAQLHIKKKNEQYTSHVNKGRKHLIFEPDDWV